MGVEEHAGLSDLGSETVCRRWTGGAGWAGYGGGFGGEDWGCGLAGSLDGWLVIVIDWLSAGLVYVRGYHAEARVRQSYVFRLLSVDGVSRVEGDCGSREGSRGWRNCALNTISYARSHMDVEFLTVRSNGAKDMTGFEAG